MAFKWLSQHWLFITLAPLLVIIRLGKRPWEVNHTFIWSLGLTVVLATVWSLWNSGMQSAVFTKTTASSLDMAFPLLFLGHFLHLGICPLVLQSWHCLWCSASQLIFLSWIQNGVDMVWKRLLNVFRAAWCCQFLSWFTYVLDQENMAWEVATASGIACSVSGQLLWVRCLFHCQN